MLGDIVHSIDDFLYFFRDTVFLMVIFTAVFKKRILQNNCILYAVTITVAGIAWRQIYFFLLKLLTDRGSIRRPDDVFPLQEGTPNIRPLMLLIFAVFMGCLLTKATLSHLVILTLFYIPVSGQLHPLSYTISYLWPENLLPGWNMIYVIRTLCIMLLSALLTWILIKLGRSLIKITDPFFLCLITICALGLNIAAIYLGAIMDSMFILNITYTLLVIISLLIFLLIGESSRHQAENQRLLFQQEIENSYRNYIFELEEMSQQIRLFRHEYQGKLLLMKTLLKKQDYQTLDQELQDMLEDIPTAEQLMTSSNVLEDNPDLKTTKSNPSYHGYGIRLILQIAEKYNGGSILLYAPPVFCYLPDYKKLIHSIGISAYRMLFRYTETFFTLLCGFYDSFCRIIFRFTECFSYIFFSRKLAWNRFPSASNLQVPPFFPHSFLMERIPIPSSPFSRFLE